MPSCYFNSSPDTALFLCVYYDFFFFFKYCELTYLRTLFVRFFFFFLVDQVEMSSSRANFVVSVQCPCDVPQPTKGCNFRYWPRRRVILILESYFSSPLRKIKKTRQPASWVYPQLALPGTVCLLRCPGHLHLLTPVLPNVYKCFSQTSCTLLLPPFTSK